LAVKLKNAVWKFQAAFLKADSVRILRRVQPKTDERYTNAAPFM
jgi:hypothetical protein